MLTIKKNQLKAHKGDQVISLPYFTNADSDKIVGLESNVEALNKLATYSTEETVIGTWINGKPIYRIVFTGVGGGDEKTIGTIPNLDMVINARGIILSNYGHWFNIPSYYSSTVYNTYLYCYLDGTVKLATDRAYDSIRPFFVIVEYTKTTD